MKIAIILGNRINDDGSITEILKKRLDMTVTLYNEYKPDKIILSGGIANKKVNASEAEKMREYLLEKGLPDDILILEDKSLTTFENAKYSIPIAMNYNPDTIFVCSSYDHFLYPGFNVVKIFGDAINNDNIHLLFYTSTK